MKKILKEIRTDKKNEAAYKEGNLMYVTGSCQLLSQGKKGTEVLVQYPEGEETVVRIGLSDGGAYYARDGKPLMQADAYCVAALLQMLEEEESTEPHPIEEGKAYTREGMIKRVLAERKEKAAKAAYRIEFADNIYGEHILTNEKNQRFRITLRDFDNETGYIDNADLRTNKLGTTKHIMFAFAALKDKPKTMQKMGKQYPFLEIFLDPLNEYRISWHYPHPLKPEVQQLIQQYFGEDSCIVNGQEKDFLNFIQEAAEFGNAIKIRPEVEELVQKAWDNQLLQQLESQTTIDFSQMKVPLFPYQQEGVQFATFKAGCIIADEMGLGKTIQAIGAAIMKKQHLGFKKTLIICPASLKEQWRQEILKFCHEDAVVADGMPAERAAIYRTADAYFVIVNYETVLRDIVAINKMAPDFIILDEAQKIKNFSTVTAQNIKRLKRRHALAITGTPIENKLIDLYSIAEFVNEGFLAPLWDFSYQYCYFDERTRDKITGYYNLQQLNDRLKPLLLRREKRRVLKDLPNVTEVTVPVNLTPQQADYHAGYASGIAAILRKKFITPYDQQKLMLLLGSMRMVCDSTFLVDKETYISPKLDELKYILLEKLGAATKEVKIIIFSEWVTMLQLIGKMLREAGIGFVTLSGKVQVKNRNKLVKKFESDPTCKIFLSSEAGGAGLNLQVADTVINFELPWNPAKKNQRIGRIDRLGQRSKHLTVINFVTRNSIETKIAGGLSLKQNLFDGVLNEGNTANSVDFSASGRSQFMQQLEAMMGEFGAEKAMAELGLDEVIETAPAAANETLEAVIEEENTAVETAPTDAATAQLDTMETVMNQGMQFLSGLFKMATGNAIGLDAQKIEVDKKTGEVVMRFKLPGFGG